MHAKLQAKHLSRRAVVYVRQSSLSQVHGNLESQRRQYALCEQARQLGFAEVQTIDEDLGRSAGGTQMRPGFERLVSSVCAGEVGAIFCLEASRLARNGRDWHHLLDLCALTETLLVDPDGTYDPRLTNDRLLLGLKGSMSEFELSLMHQRSHEAIRQKAKRGELRFRLPVGFEWTRDGHIVLDPDLRVQEAVHLVFKKVTELGSVRRVLLWFLKNKLLLPFVLSGDHQATRNGWKKPSYSTVLFMLKNPLYAGAYAYGRTQVLTRIVDGRARKTTGHSKPTKDWNVLLLDHHPGYIPWSEYQRNQQMMAEHAHRSQPTNPKQGRGGGALLSGIVRCRRCGRKMQVLYRGGARAQWSYHCTSAAQRQGAPRCLHLGGHSVDGQVSTVLLQAVSPLAIEAAIHAAQQQQQACVDAVRAVELEAEQARYQVELNARRYEEVDPSNRLVALELERRWEAALSRAAELERRVEQMRTRSTVPDQPSQEQLLALARDLPAVWNSPGADMALKQRLCRLMIHEVMCDLDRDRGEVVLVVHWQGGQHSELRFPKNVTGRNRRCAPAAARELLYRLGSQISEADLAALLNERGLRTGTNRPWTANVVRAYLNNHRIARFQGSQHPTSLTSKDGGA